MIGACEPAPRTAVTSSCMPAAVYGTLVQAPPSRQQVQSSGYGSVERSDTTEPLVANVAATSDQNAGEWSRSGIGACPAGNVVPGALQCSSTIAAIPCAAMRATKSAIAAR